MNAGVDAWVVNARSAREWLWGHGPADPRARAVGRIYLYSKFSGVGGTFAANGGFEEWAVKGSPGGSVQTLRS